MQWQAYFQLLERRFEPQRCQKLIEGIYQGDRWFSFPAFERTAGFCAEAMRTAGLSEVEQLPLAADGKTAYGDWVIPRAWAAESASLCTIDGTPLADYQQTPCSLVMYSAPTPPGGLTAPVVDADALNGPGGEELQGALLLTGRPAKELVPLAKQKGAVGIVSDFFPLYPGVRESREEMGGHSRWDNDFIVPRNTTGLFAFSLSPQKGDWLRQRLREGPLQLHAEVRARFYDGKCYTVSGAILGTQPELPEIFAYGHLYEPGANDNASGCGLLLELMRCLNAAAQAGMRPRRTIRLAVGYECAGSMGYLCAHPERRMLCGIVADMVGTAGIDRARLSLWHNPLSNRSFADTALSSANRLYQEYTGRRHAFEERPFTVGSDNILGDPSLRLPTVAMITEPALSYHSSMDTPERIEPAVLRQNAMILGAFLLGMANAGEEDARFLAREITRKQEQLENRPGISDPEKRLLQEAIGRERASLAALTGAKAAPAVETPFPMPHEARRLGGGRVPQRRIRGCLTFQGRPELAASRWAPAWNDALNLPLFWADGRRCLWEIAVRAAIEEGKTDGKQFFARFSELLPYFEFLEKHRYIRWKEPGTPAGAPKGE